MLHGYRRHLCTASQIAFSATSNDYFPLKPGTVWEYTTDQGGTAERIVLKKNRHGKWTETSVVKYVDEGLRTYFSSDLSGIYSHREYEPSVCDSGAGRKSIDVTFDPPLKFGNATFEVGDSFHSEGTAQHVWLEERLISATVQTITVEGTETVSVPAGTFDTIRVRMELALMSGGYGDFTTTRS